MNKNCFGSTYTLKSPFLLQVMVTVQRRDLQVAIPALRKLDALLLVRPPSHFLVNNSVPSSPFVSYILILVSSLVTSHVRAILTTSKIIMSFGMYPRMLMNLRRKIQAEMMANGGFPS